MNKSFPNLLAYLVASLPVALITGSFLPDLILSLSVIFFLLYIFKNKKFYFFKNNIFYVFILFYLICLLSSALSDYNKEEFFKIFFYFRFGVLILIIRYLINNHKEFLIIFRNVLFFCFIILFFDSIVQLIFGKNIFLFSHPPGRITSFFYDESIMGSYIFRLSMLLFALIIFLDGKLNYKKLLLIISCCFFLVIISGERTAIFSFGLLIFLTFLILEISFIKKFKFFLIFFSSSTIIFFSLIFLNEEIKFRIVDQTLSQVNFNYKNTIPTYKEVIVNNKPRVLAKNNTFLPLQYDLYFRVSKKIFLDHPIIGSGPKTFKYISENKKYLIIESHGAFKEFDTKKFHYEGFTNLKSSGRHPHNIYLQVFSETGVFGGIIVLGTFIFSFISIFTRIEFEKKLILISVITNLFPFFLSGNFFNNWLSIIIFIPIGFVYLKENTYNDKFN